METGVLSGLQLKSMFPQLVLENFYFKTRNSLTDGSSKAPYGYVFPVQRDMTKVATLLNILRAQGIEIGQLTAAVKAGTETFPAGSYLIKLNQPYGRLAKNLLEKQDFPDPALETYDDSGWSMGYAFNLDVKEIKEKSILTARSSTGEPRAASAARHLSSEKLLTPTSVTTSARCSRRMPSICCAIGTTGFGQCTW